MMLANTVRKVLRPARRGESQRTLPRIVIQMEASPSGNAKLKPTMSMPNLSFANTRLVIQ
ncbi:MAG: hypothetical protein EXR93_01810 [Gemmatimonadetes bacterium]|nr:hypothetical protein [Gemmatimonadota bacterium]